MSHIIYTGNILLCLVNILFKRSYPLFSVTAEMTFLFSKNRLADILAPQKQQSPEISDLSKATKLQKQRVCLLLGHG